MRIELTTGALQVLLAPLDHAGPYNENWVANIVGRYATIFPTASMSSILRYVFIV